MGECLFKSGQSTKGSFNNCLKIRFAGRGAGTGFIALEGRFVIFCMLMSPDTAPGSAHMAEKGKKKCQ